jgi:hypothetical protein
MMTDDDQNEIETRKLARVLLVALLGFAALFVVAGAIVAMLAR